MADHKAEPAIPRTTHTPLAPGQFADAVAPGHLVALLAILTRAIANVRLFVDTGDDRVQQFEAPLPPAPLLRPLARWLMMPPAPLDEDSPLGESVPGLYETAPTTTPDPALFLDVLQDLIQPADPTAFPARFTKEAGTAQAAGLVRPYDPDALAAWLFNEPPSLPDTTLDLVFDRPSDTWRLEFSAPPELRGESLADLRGSAPALPQSSETAAYDLPRDAYYTASAAARYLQVDRSTITRRVARDELIGFTVFKRALRIPRDQFLDLDVVPGIPQALALFARPTRGSVHGTDHKSAWTFLAGDLFHGDPDPRPIDRLRRAAGQGTTDAVLAELARAKESLDRGDHF